VRREVGSGQKLTPEPLDPKRQTLPLDSYIDTP